MSKLLSVPVAILFVVTAAYAAKPPKSSDITAGASGSLQLSQISYAPGSTVQIDYSYAGLPVGANNYLVLQTLCTGTWNGVVFDTSSEFFQSDKVVYSSATGSGTDQVTVPSTYQGSGGCTASLYLLFTVNNTRYSKTLATATFNVAVQ